MRNLLDINKIVRRDVLHRRRGRTMNHRNESSKSNPDMLAIKAAAKHYFGPLDGVEGIGIGDRRLRVYILTEHVAKDLPREFQGVPVDYIVTGEIKLYGSKGE